MFVDKEYAIQCPKDKEQKSKHWHTNHYTWNKDSTTC